MSYNYSINKEILITGQRFKEFCWAHDIKFIPQHAMNVLRDEYKVHSDPVAHGLEVFTPTVSERLGIKGIEDALAPILKFAQPGDYHVTDEYGETATITVE